MHEFIMRCVSLCQINCKLLGRNLWRFEEYAYISGEMKNVILSLLYKGIIITSDELL